MRTRTPKPIDVEMWAAVRPDGAVIPCFLTRSEAIQHVTAGEGIDGRPCSWRQAKAAGWRVVKVRVREVRR